MRRWRTVTLSERSIFNGRHCLGNIKEVSDDWKAARTGRERELVGRVTLVATDDNEGA